jgi:hypothetical protein
VAFSPEFCFRAFADAPLFHEGVLPPRAVLDLLIPAFQAWTPELASLVEQTWPRYHWKAARPGHEFSPDFRALVAGDFAALATRLGDNAMAALRDDLAHAWALPRRLPREWPAMLPAAEWEARKHLIAYLPEIEKARAFWKLISIILRWPGSCVVADALQDLAERFKEPCAREFGEALSDGNTTRALDLLDKMGFKVPPRRLEKSKLLRSEKTKTIIRHERKFAAVAARFGGIPPPEMSR